MTRTGSELQHRPARPAPPEGRARAPREAEPATRWGAARRAREQERSEARRSRQPAPPARRMKLSPLGMGVGATATVALFVGVALLSAFLTPSGPPGAGTPPATVQVLARTEAASVAFDSTGGWLVDDHAGTVRHFDPSSGATVGRAIHVGGRPMAVAAGFGRIWVADIAGNRISEINPVTRRVVGAAIPVAQGPVSLAAGDGGVWVASLLAGTVSVIDPRTAQVEASTALPDGAVRLAVGPDGVWVTGQTHTLTRVSRSPDGASLRWRTVGVGQGPLGVAVGDGSVWVANVQSGTVSRVDPASLRVTATYPVHGAGGGQADPEMVALWQDRLWVADGQEGVVVALDPATGHQVGSAVALPGVIRQMVLVGGDTLWGTTANPGTVVRFG